MSSSREEDTSPAAKAAAATTTLAALTPLSPNDIPLLVSFPGENGVRQVNVPANSSIDDIKSRLSDAGANHGSGFDLSFANTTLQGGATLDSTNIVDAYSHAGNLLRVIRAGDLDPGQQQQAIESACAVVRQVSNGVTNMEELCAAALKSSNMLPSPGLSATPGDGYEYSVSTIERSLSKNISSRESIPNSAGEQNFSSLGMVLHGSAALSTTDNFVQAGASNPAPGGNQPSASRIGSSEFRMLHNILSQPTPPHNANSEYAPNPAAIYGQHPVIAQSGIVLGGDGTGAPSPNSLVLSLSRRLPDLFTPAATSFVVGNSGENAAHEVLSEGSSGASSQAGVTDSSVPRDSDDMSSRRGAGGPEDRLREALEQKCSLAQPSIATIRDIRRRERQRRTTADLATIDDGADDSGISSGVDTPQLPSERADRVDDHLSAIGHSTINVGSALPDGSAPVTDLSSDAKVGEAILASTSTSTWLEDVMKTWEVGLVRRSGVLDSTEQGAELNGYLQSLENDTEQDSIGAGTTTDYLAKECLEGSDEEYSEEEDDGDESVGAGEDNVSDSSEPHQIGSNMNQNFGAPANLLTQFGMGHALVTGGKILSPDCSSSTAGHTDHSVGDQSRTCPSMETSAGIHPAPPASFTRGSDLPNVQWPYTGVHQRTDTSNYLNLVHDRTSTGLLCGTAVGSVPLNYELQSTASGTTPPLPPPHAKHILPRKPNTTISKSAPVAPRLAPKIAPAVNQDASQGHAPPAYSQYASKLSEAVGGSPYLLPTKPTAKKRGRKRKNPELTDEERALFRKLQNRESAKLSRVRRKVIAAEYEDQISDLIAKNDGLRNQVNALNNRLSVLQSLLTVHVTPHSRQVAPSHADAHSSSGMDLSGTLSMQASASRVTSEYTQQSSMLSEAADIRSGQENLRGLGTDFSGEADCSPQNSNVEQELGRDAHSSYLVQSQYRGNEREDAENLQQDQPNVAGGSKSVIAHV